MACPKRLCGRMFKGVRFTLYEYGFPSLELAKEFVKKCKWPKDRVKIVTRPHCWDVYVREIIPEE